MWPGHQYDENYSDFNMDIFNVSSDRSFNVTLYPRFDVDLELDQEFVYIGGTLGVTLNVTLSLGEIEVTDEYGTYWETISGPPVVGLNSSLFSAWVHNWNYQYSEEWWGNPVENEYHDYMESLNVTEVSDGIYQFNFTVPNRLPYNDTNAYWLDLEVRVANSEAWRGFSVLTGDVYTISGTVYNESMHVIPYAEIDVIMGMEWGTFVEADEFGNYSVLVPAGNYSMMFFGPEEGEFYLPSFIDVEVDSDIVQDAVLTSLPEEFTMIFVSMEIDGNTTNLGQVVLDMSYSLPHVIEVTPEAPLDDVDPTYLPEAGYRWKDIREKWNSTSSTLKIIFLYIEDSGEGDNTSVAPYNPDPADGADNVSLSTVLSWNVSGPDVGPLTYYVYFSDDLEGLWYDPPVAEDINETWYSPGMLYSNTTYYWMVEADDGMDWTEGAIWNFTTEAEPAPPPEEWNVSISVGVGIYSAMNATFGMRDGANSSFNPYLGDYSLPPGNAGVESYFYYPDEPNPTFKKLVRSYLSHDVPANWTFRVYTYLGVSGLTTMEWNVTEVEAIPGGYNVTLVTPTGVSVDMIDLGSYEWTAEEETRYTFIILVEEAVP